MNLDIPSSAFLCHSCMISAGQPAFLMTNSRPSLTSCIAVKLLKLVGHINAMPVLAFGNPSKEFASDGTNLEILTHESANIF